MKKKYLLIIPVVVILAFILFRWNQNKKSFELVKPKVGPITEVIYGLGTVQSYYKFNFKSGVGKTLNALYVQEGQKVSKGTKLLRFEDGPTVSSPFDGTVLSIPYNVGENVFADRTVVSVEDLEKVFIESHLDQVASLRVKAGLKARISFENLRNELIEGQVTTLYPSMGQFIAKIEVKKLPKEILPGMTADVAIEVASKDRALLIPIKSISNKFITLIRNKDKQKHEVKLGIMDQEWAEEISGEIKEEDLILVRK